jgi:hypothetical protein
LFIPNTLETDTRFKVACSLAALLPFFHDKDFKGKTARGNAFEECDKYFPAPLSDMWLNTLLKHPAEKLSIVLTTILTHQEVRPSSLGGVPPFHQNIFLTGNLVDKFRQGHWTCRADTPPTSEEMKSQFTVCHILLMRHEAGNKPMIPTDGLMHAPSVVLINHLVWFLESAVEEDQDKQCHYSPGASIFRQGVISPEQITVVGDAMWEQTSEHCRAFSAINMQLLHGLCAIFLRWIMMAP